MCRRRKGGRCTKGTAGKDISKIIYYSFFFSNLDEIVEVVWHILTLVKNLVLKIVFFGKFSTSSVESSDKKS